MHKFILPVFLALIFLNCETSSSYVKKTPPNQNFATAKKGETLYSVSEFRMFGNTQRIVYKNWKFDHADKKNIYFIYEENLDFLKIEPDLKKDVTIPYTGDDKIQIEGMVITIYNLTDSSISYYMEPAP